MEKKETTATSTGMCEKLFNAFNPTLRPLRRLTFRRPDPEPTSQTTTLSPPDHPSLNAPAKQLCSPTIPQAAAPPENKPYHTTPPSKPSVQLNATKAEPAVPPKPTSTTTTIQEIKVSVIPSPAPPHALQKETVKPQPPTVALPKPQPPPVDPAPKKTINDKFEEYISRARAKMRSTDSSVGRAPTVVQGIK